MPKSDHASTPRSPWAAAQPITTGRAPGTAPTTVAPPTAPTQPAAPPAETSTIAAPKPVDDAVWTAMADRPLTVELRDGSTVSGKLIATEGTHVVLMGEDNVVNSVAKADAITVRAQEATEAAPTDATPQEAIPETKPINPPAEEGTDRKPISEDQPTKEEWPYKKLGVYTSHGIGYSHWRGSSYRSGGATYALDAAVGYNFSHKFGVYGLIGGAVGARLLGGSARGHYGHFALQFLVRRKHFAFLPGIGLAMSTRKGPNNQVIKEAGLAVPLKLMGLIKLPKDLFLGIGMGYDLAIMADARLAQTISGQVTVGRW